MLPQKKLSITKTLLGVILIFVLSNGLVMSLMFVPFLGTKPANAVAGQLKIVTPQVITQTAASFTIANAGSTTASQATVTGSGTTFTKQIKVGDRVGIGAETKTVKVVTNDTSLTMDSNWSNTNSSQTMTVYPSLMSISDASGNNRLVISDQGTVGINNYLPSTSTKLDIGGTNSVISNSSGNITITPTSNLIISQGNVGIGKASPVFLLDVAGSASFSGTLSLGPITAGTAGTCNATNKGKQYFDGVTNQLNYCDGTNWSKAGVSDSIIAAFNGSCPTGWTEYTAARGRTVVGTPASGTNGGTVGTALTNLENRTHTHNIGNSGNGGGGPSQSSVTDPAYTSDVIAYIQLTYCSKNAGADLAEWIKGSPDLSQATIVSADPQNDQKVVISEKPYDTTVVGIVSTSPGWLISSEKPGKIQMALAGRVPVRVSLMNGNINRGDPITTSSIPGVGMKATKAGSIIGKALDSLTENSSIPDCVNPTTGKNEKCGKIVILVNLSWYDPDIYLTSTGDLHISGQPDGTFTLRDKNDSVITRIGAFAELAVANLKAGLINTKKLVLDGMDVAQKINDITVKIDMQQKEIEGLKLQIEKLQK